MSASTSEVLAKTYEIDSDFAFSSALLRQLGYALIAWNYPEIYEKAAQQLSPERTLDQSLGQLLGFSPMLLAVTLLERWGAEKQFCSTLVFKEELALMDIDEESEERDAARDTLVKLCRVGEALARANNPQLYPSAKNDWALAMREVEERLGPEGLEAIRDNFKSTCTSYLTLAPHAFKAGLALDPEFRLADQHDAEVEQRNPYLDGCRDYLKGRLYVLYGKLCFGEIDAELVNFMVKEVIPTSGFKSGCVYTFDPTTISLVPRLVIGTGSLADYNTVQYTGSAPSNDFIQAVFKQGQVATQLRRTPEGLPVLGVAGLLGVSQRVGVVYLEMAATAFENDRDQHTVHFKALTQALNDCLALG